VGAGVNFEKMMGMRGSCFFEKVKTWWEYIRHNTRIIPGRKRNTRPHIDLNPKTPSTLPETEGKYCPMRM
jgi:hypothetical protein